ncbi:MAG: hypothetical protein A4E63_02310 [Syntrophorhabdus sp. PtaU1.Bin050]|nr:MAG: hypothetical protein A4E63_02310 [Syntrophorhabdus sp. PtaU1.Bin050]
MKSAFVRLAILGTEQKVLLLLIFLGVVIRFYNVITASAIDMDGIEYVSAARDFIAGRFGKALSAIRLPAFPAAIAFFHFFVPDIELAGRVVSLVFGLLLIVLCFRFARQLWGEEKAYWLAAFVAIHPYLIEYSARVLSESLATFLFAGSFFFFYQGWVTGNTRRFFWAGAFLTFAYLTKPEYIIYFLPLSLVLLWHERKARNIPTFLACCVLVAFTFLIYLRLHTGFWIIDRKMLSWGGQGQQSSMFSYLAHVISAPAVLKNIPVVFYHFCEAIYLPFLFLAFVGFKRADSSFVALALMLVASHIFGRSFILHATKRYSLEFAPIIMVFAMNGVGTARNYLTRFSYGKPLSAILLFVMAGVLLFEGIAFPNYGRQMEKKAGLMLRASGEGKSIASRLPILAFYADGNWTNLEAMLQEARTCEDLQTVLLSKKIGYVVVDNKIERSFPFIKDCTPNLPVFAYLKNGKEQMRIYRRAGS